ncbi:helix-turn-helix domain-containing protein [Mangrovibacter sp. SLW1]
METEKTSKQVIARAATILKIISQSMTGMNITALSRSCGLPRSTVHRMVATLEEQQLVINAKEGVRLGPALLSLASAAHTDFVTVARPAVVALGRRTRETVDVSVSRGLHAVLVDQYASDRELRVVSALALHFLFTVQPTAKRCWRQWVTPYWLRCFLKLWLPTLPVQ